MYDTHLYMAFVQMVEFIHEHDRVTPHENQAP